MVVELNITVRCDADEEIHVVKRIDSLLGVLKVDVNNREVVWREEDYEEILVRD